MATAMAAPGKFISFEGGEGCGKSTQVKRLLARLKAQGQEVLYVREPGGTSLGEIIRDLLQHHPAGEGMTKETELLLFAASRAQLVRAVLQPALEAGKLVVADRFMDSTTVYQGMGRAISRTAVDAINQFAVGPCTPQVTFVLDIPVEVGLARAADRSGGPDRMESAGLAFHEAVRAGYQALAAQFPERIVLIDAALSMDAVEAQILEKLVEMEIVI